MNKKIIPLKRTLSLPLVTFYGLGTILGGGIYALIGKVTQYAGMHIGVVFLLAALIASFTAISYAELSSRLPLSAGEAYYVKTAFNQNWLAGLVGWMVVFTGIVSSATLVHAFAGYLKVFVPIPHWLSFIGIIFILGGLAAWGIRISAMVAMLITLIEIGGLLLVIFITGDSLKQLPSHWQQLIPISLSFKEWSGILVGAFLAFYAYIGFEDMVNIAEEIKNPAKTLPIAIFLALGMASLLYFMVGIVAVFALPIETLAKSNAPLALIIEHKGYSPILISVISLIAIINGALVQIIMSSRVIYGMAKQRNAPILFSKVHPKTQTPLFATSITMLSILIFTFLFPIETLAKTTSGIILSIFIMIHLSLIVIKMRKYRQAGAVSYSIFFPITGAVLCSLFLLFQLL